MHSEWKMQEDQYSIVQKIQEVWKVRSVLNIWKLKKMQEIIVDTLMVEDEEMVSTMKRVFEENDKTYCICPHTAVGVAYFYKNSSVLPQES